MFGLIVSQVVKLQLLWIGEQWVFKLHYFRLFFLLECLSLKQRNLYLLSVFASVYLLAVWGMLLLILFVYATSVLSKIKQKSEQISFETTSVNYKILAENLRNYETIRSFGQTEWALPKWDQIYSANICIILPGNSAGFRAGNNYFTVYD